MMEPLEPDVVRVLAFIDQINRGGDAPTRDAVNAFAKEPSPPDASWQFRPAPSLHAAIRQMAAIDVAAWLQRLELIDDGYVVHLTPSGRAILQASNVDEASMALMLTPGDDLSYAQLVTRLSADGTCLADPYIRLEQLNQLINETAVSRVLTSTSRVGENELLGMGALAARAAVEVRAVDDEAWHDRYVVSPDEVFMLGASVNGLHRNITALLPVVDQRVAQQVRDFVESLWSEAEDLVRRREAEESPSGRDTAS